MSMARFHNARLTLHKHSQAAGFGIRLFTHDRDSSIFAKPIPRAKVGNMDMMFLIVGTHTFQTHSYATEKPEGKTVYKILKPARFLLYINAWTRNSPLFIIGLKVKKLNLKWFC